MTRWFKRKFHPGDLAEVRDKEFPIWWLHREGGGIARKRAGYTQADDLVKKGYWEEVTDLLVDEGL